ncbi:MAG: S41 family peptidase, partial [Anaerolineae bacterium]
RATVPEAVQNKHLILVGRLDATYSGEIIRGLLTAGEIEAIRAAGGQGVVLEKDSPWAEGRRVILCAGTDLLSARNAAEDAVRAIIAGAPPASAWIRTTFDAAPDDTASDDAAREYVDRLLFAWEDAELPLAELTMDVGAKPRARISAAQAAEDVERLFYLFSHGYAGYAFFSQDGAFDRAKGRILEAVSAKSTWSAGDLARLFREELGFISDCHMKIGDYAYGEHLDFWYDTSLELALAWEGYQFAVDDTLYTIVSVNAQDPEAFVFPSLNARGEPIYRLGVLSREEPAPLVLVTTNEVEERPLEIALERSDFAYYSKDLFREDEVGGIPVIRVRSFSDHHAQALEPFVETASAHRGEPALIVDVRGNGGGNEAWPIRWIQGLTGRRAESVFIFSELNSKTTMAGRANVFAYMYDLYPRTDSYRAEAERFTQMAAAYEDETYQPSWGGPRYPPMPLIPNETTLILVMNGLVASSGEGLIMRASQAENVVLVGENTMGALTFGNAGTHQLPHSRLMVHLPTNFGLYLDRTFREEKGLFPDLWVPAADAVNYAVAAVRSGTIATHQPLSPATLQQPFVPEDPWARVRQERTLLLLVIGLMVMAGSVWAFSMRKKPHLVTIVGAVWLAIGSVWRLWMEKPVGYGFLLVGAVCLVWGGINLWRTHRSPAESQVSG